MTRYSLKSSIKTAVKKSFFLTLITCVCFVVGFYYYFYYAILEIERENVSMTLNILMENLNGSMEKLELHYKGIMKTFLNELYEESKATGPEGARKYFENNKYKISGSFDMFLFNAERVDYYCISPEGIITETSYITDMNLDMKFYTVFWAEMKSMRKGEVFSGVLANESQTEKLRFYSYVKLEDGSSFEIGISFNNVSNDIEKMMSKYLSKYNTKVDIYSAEFVPLYSDGKNELTDEEMLVFIDSIESDDFTIRKSFSNVTFYKTWHTRFGSRFIKINVEIKQVYIFLVLFSVMVMVIIMILYFVMRYIFGISEKLILPITTLSKAMKTFWDRGEGRQVSELDSEITEVYEIQKSFVNMMGEINGKVKELELANEKISLSANENSDLVEKMDMILSMVLNIFEFDDREEFFVEVFSKVFGFLEYADGGMLVVKSEDSSLKIIKSHNCDVSVIKGKILNYEGIKFPAEVIFSDNRISLLDSMVNENASPDTVEVLREYEKLNFDRSVIIPISSDKTEYGFMIMRIKDGIDPSGSGEILKVSDFFSKLLKMYMLFSEYSEIEFTMQRDIIKSFIKILEFHDLYTKGHSENVAEIAMRIGRRFGLDSEALNDLYWAGMVHDIGKVLIPGSVLNKASPLTEEEFRLIRNHPVYAYDILDSAVSMKKIAMLVRYHHERYDGKGYPDGVAGEDIPIESRILSLADAWDSMTRDRVYRRAIDRKEAIDELVANSGLQFDPRVVEVFMMDIDNILDEKGW